MQEQQAGPGSKVCKGCHEEHPLYLYPLDKQSPDGNLHLCYPCRAEVNRRNHYTECVLYPDLPIALPVSFAPTWIVDIII